MMFKQIVNVFARNQVDFLIPIPEGVGKRQKLFFLLFCDGRKIMKKLIHHGLCLYVEN
jgi:hypothetical protein